MAITVLPRKLIPRNHVIVILVRDAGRGVGLGGVGLRALAADVGVVVLSGIGGVGEGRGGPLDGVFDVEHGVVDAGGGGEVVGAEVEEGEEGGCEAGGEDVRYVEIKAVWRIEVGGGEGGVRERCIQGCDGECGHGFVETAHHDAGFVVPCCWYAMVTKRPAQVPGQEGEAEDPEEGEGGVAVEVVLGGEGTEGVEEACDEKSGEGEERDNE